MFVSHPFFQVGIATACGFDQQQNLVRAFNGPVPTIGAADGQLLNAGPQAVFNNAASEGCSDFDGHTDLHAQQFRVGGIGAAIGGFCHSALILAGRLSFTGPWQWYSNMSKDAAAEAMNNRTRLRQLLRLAWPMMFAQIAFLGLILTDTLVAGRYSPEALAGVSLGAAVIMPGYNLLMGLSLAAAPAVSRLIGERTRRKDIANWVSGAGALALAGWLVLALLIESLAAPVSAWVAPEALVESETRAYLRLSALGLPFIGAFLFLRNVLEAHSVSRPIMWLGVAALPINALLDTLLIHGYGPLPAMGAAGCGLATAIVQTLLGFGVWWTLRRHTATRDLRLTVFWKEVEVQGPIAKDYLRLGGPVGLSLTAESSLFALGGLLMARYGTAAVGAHQICITVAALVFMVQVALGQATAVLLGRAMGARDAEALKQTARLGVGLGLILALAVCTGFLLGRNAIPALFSTDPAVLEFGAVFMVWAAAFHLSDAMQAIHAATLRGIHETQAILRLTLVAYFFVSIPMMLILTFATDAPATGIWWSFGAGLLVAAVLLMHRFWMQLRKLLSGWESSAAF